MSTQSSPLLGRPIGKIIAGLIVVTTLFSGLFFFSINITLLYEGYFEGSWYIDDMDFRLTIFLQFLLGIGVIISSLYWLRDALRVVIRHSQWKSNKMGRLILACIIGFTLLIATHRWFEAIICDRGSDPNECGL